MAQFASNTFTRGCRVYKKRNWPDKKKQGFFSTKDDQTWKAKNG